MNFIAPFQIGITNAAGDVLASIPGGPDNNEWQSLEEARAHMGIRLSPSAGRLFVLDADGDKVEEIYPCTAAQIAKHAEYDAYMEVERAERRKAWKARMEVKRLERMMAL